MATQVHMQDQVKNRIQALTRDSRRPSLNDYAETAATLLIMFVFMLFGMAW